MATGPRDYSETTKKKLFALSGNLCAFPGCPVQIVSDIGSDDLMTQICHIEGANPGSERFNKDMTDDERRSFQNLVLFCPNHHIETNNEKEYSVQRLKNIKQNHESYVIQKKLQQKPSLLLEAINCLSSLNVDEAIISESNTTFDIEEKISHNKLIRYRPIIEEYKVLHGKIDSLYQEIESQGSFKKSSLLRNIQLTYLKVKGEFLSEIGNELQQIQSNADNIFARVEEELGKCLEADMKFNLYPEDIHFGITIIMVDAFMRCKILEQPTTN